MKTLICRHCGCSLVRLGVNKDKAVTYRHKGEEHYFCCQGCSDEFKTDPPKYLEETKDVIVCPTCLAEKPPQWSAILNWSGQELHFCRCPYCREQFQKDPNHYIDRLEGRIPFETELRHS